MALLVNLGIAGVFALCGYLAARGSRKAFVTGMILYGLDGILLVALGEATMATFHAVVLFMLFLGFPGQRAVTTEGLVGVLRRPDG